MKGAALGSAVAASPDEPVHVDLVGQTIAHDDFVFGFAIGQVGRDQLLNGWDDN